MGITQTVCRKQYRTQHVEKLKKQCHKKKKKKENTMIVTFMLLKRHESVEGNGYSMVTDNYLSIINTQNIFAVINILKT